MASRSGPIIIEGGPGLCCSCSYLCPLPLSAQLHFTQFCTAHPQTNLPTSEHTRVTASLAATIVSGFLRPFAAPS